MSQVKKTQTSRKGKKAWRKNIDISQIEESQEELRATERAFGGKPEELKNEDLFTIDVAGDSSVKRRLAKDRPLKVDQILQQRSAVPALKNKNAFKKPEMTDKLASKNEQKILKRKMENIDSVKPKKKKAAKKSYDLWGEEPMEEEEEVSDFIPKPVAPKAPKTLNVKPTAATHIPAVVTPEKGQSYNPTMEDHQELLAKANDAEERKAEILKKLQEQLSYREELKLLADELAHSQIDAEGNMTVKTDDEEEEEQVEGEAKDTKKKKKNERKTRQQRHKSHRLATAELERKQKLQEKLIRQQVDKLRDIEKELNERLEELDALAEKRGERKLSEEKKGIKKLGKYTVPELPLDVQLTDELCETLRQLKPEGNMFRDRFHSIQKRNIIEPRIPVAPSRKYKLKEYERRAYKNFDQAEEIKKKRKAAARK